MRIIAVMTVFCLLFCIVASISAQEPEVTVGEITLPPLQWGKQQAAFELTNNTDMLKFLTIKIEIRFAASYLPPQRETTDHIILNPFESKMVNPYFDMPAKYGQTEMKVTIYDVVDTLDALLPSQKFFEQPFILNFRVPDQIFPYRSEKITLPPMVESHPDFDQEFMRILIMMLNEGKTVPQISEVAGISSVVVMQLIKELVDKHYAKLEGDKYVLTIPVITMAEAQATRELVESVSDTLTAKITQNMPAYRSIIDSLVAAGSISADSNEFLDGGTVLYYTYPVVGGLLLWFDMGQQFITRTAPLMIYDNTDLCKAHIPYYMYAVEGGDVFNGSQFYALAPYARTFRILFGDSIPEIRCKVVDYLRKQRNWMALVNYAEEYRPETFMVDTLAVKPALAALRGDIGPFLADTYKKLFSIANRYGHYKLGFGHRYWFWNLAATRTLEKLTDSGVIVRQGNGQYRFDAKAK